jgi:hypothetical protein
MSATPTARAAWALRQCAYKLKQLSRYYKGDSARELSRLAQDALDAAEVLECQPQSAAK